MKGSLFGPLVSAALNRGAWTINWYHKITPLDKVKDQAECEFYIRETIANGWSRKVLALQIQSGLYERQSKALTNFELTLPKPQSDLAQNFLKDRSGATGLINRPGRLSITG